MSIELWKLLALYYFNVNIPSCGVIIQNEEVTSLAFMFLRDGQIVGSA